MNKTKKKKVEKHDIIEVLNLMRSQSIHKRRQFLEMLTKELLPELWQIHGK